jgi:hypothetical protein
MTKVATVIAATAAGWALGCGGGGSNAPTGPDAGDTSSVSVEASAHGPHDASADASPHDSATSDAEAGMLPAALDLHCAATTSPIHPNPCPAPSAKSGKADFCYRPQWAGVTSVDVYGGFGQATDWKMPFVTLTNDGSGAFTGSGSIADGSYPYVFRVTGGADDLVPLPVYFNDQENPDFEPAPAASPFRRSVSILKVPQTAAPLVHIKGTVVYQGIPAGCYPIEFRSGRLVVDHKDESEQGTSNFAESATDGTFDFPVAASAPPYEVLIRFPFHLSGAHASYPDPSITPSVGVARSAVVVGNADTLLGLVDISYPVSDYAAMSPTSGSATLPVKFAFTVIAGASGARVAVIGSNDPGDDAAYASGYSTSTSATWDGGFNGEKGGAEPGKTYYWGTWQQRAPLGDAGLTWNEESLLFPITIH